MTQPAGWYDDPQDPDSLRYWDGVQWTHHTSPRQRPAPPQASGQWGGQQPAPGQSQGGYGNQYGTQGGPAHNPYAGQTGQNPYQGGIYASSMNRDTTPDGQPLAGWWLRLLARIIDNLLIGIVVGTFAVLVLTPNLIDTMTAWMDDVIAAIDVQSTELPAIPDSIFSDILVVTLTIAGAALIYEIVLTTLWGGTLGKLATGLRVRLRDQPGNIGWSTATVRALVWNGPGVLSNIPLVGFLFSIFTLLNGLWPLWDDKKQSLNDKVAKTNVVRRGR